MKMMVLQLLFNITKSIYVPTHTLMNDNEKKKFQEKYNINKIPKINLNDPVVKFIGGKLDNIVKITRKSLTNEVYYRLII